MAAFVPHALPPRDPPIDLAAISDRLRKAEQAIGRLQLAGAMVLSVDWFLYAFVRKEAVLSSQIEGTQATLVDLLGFEADEIPGSPDLDEVCNYIDALAYARRRLMEPRGPPLSMRLLNETHAVLMRGVRGASKQPGEIRHSQNWIGGVRPGSAMYVPPPPHLLADVLGALEKYIHARDDLPPLVRVGLIHAQFETIHPYLDGNGRIGRLLIALLLEHWRLLQSPILYLSLFFKQHRDEYYRRLNATRADGDWEGWLNFFLDGVGTMAEEAVTSATDLFGLVSVGRTHLLSLDNVPLGALKLFEQLPRHPIVTAASVMKLLETNRPTAARAIQTLVKQGILVERTGRLRDQSFAYLAYLEKLRLGTDLAEPVPLRPAVVRKRRKRRAR